MSRRKKLWRTVSGYYRCWSRWGARRPSEACRAASGRRWWRSGPPSCRTCATSTRPLVVRGRRTTVTSFSSGSRCGNRTGVSIIKLFSSSSLTLRLTNTTYLPLTNLLLIRHDTLRILTQAWIFLWKNTSLFWCCVSREEKKFDGVGTWSSMISLKCWKMKQNGFHNSF